MRQIIISECIQLIRKLPEVESFGQLIDWKNTSYIYTFKS